MHNCIVGIYAFYLQQSEFSNVSSNCLSEPMQSRIDCICLAFLHCAFSNVASKHLDQSTHNHTGCICLTFLHCAFSNVASNRLPEKLHSCIDCSHPEIVSESFKTKPNLKPVSTTELIQAIV